MELNKVDRNARILFMNTGIMIKNRHISWRQQNVDRIPSTVTIIWVDAVTCKIKTLWKSVVAEVAVCPHIASNNSTRNGNRKNQNNRAVRFVPSIQNGRVILFTW
jgi:hypothetical protein